MNLLLSGGKDSLVLQDQRPDLNNLQRDNKGLMCGKKKKSM